MRPVRVICIWGVTICVCCTRICSVFPSKELFGTYLTVKIFSFRHFEHSFVAKSIYITFGNVVDQQACVHTLWSKNREKYFVTVGVIVYRFSQLERGTLVWYRSSCGITHWGYKTGGDR